MTISEIVAFLEDAYDILNVKYFNGELPKAVITIQSSPKAYGHFTPWDAWKENENGYKEINIGAETLNRSVYSVLSTMIHEQIHYYCFIHNIKDTSRSGYYHSKKFKIEAEKRGLIIEYDKTIGYSITSPSPELIEFINEQGWQGVDLARQGQLSFSGGNNGRTKSNVRKYLCPECGCSVRATKSVNIACLDCDCPMELVEKVG